MALFDNFSGIPVASGFKLQAKAPLDPRLVIATIADRDALVAENGAYEGMQVYVKADKKTYCLKDLSTPTWEEVGDTKYPILTIGLSDLNLTDNLFNTNIISDSGSQKIISFISTNNYPDSIVVHFDLSALSYYGDVVCSKSYLSTVEEQTYVGTVIFTDYISYLLINNDNGTVNFILFQTPLFEVGYRDAQDWQSEVLGFSHGAPGRNFGVFTGEELAIFSVRQGIKIVGGHGVTLNITPECITLNDKKVGADDYYTKEETDNKISAAKFKDLATFSIAVSDWQPLSDAEPYTMQAVKTITFAEGIETIDENSSLFFSFDDIVASTGVVVASATGTNALLVTFYAVTTPTKTITGTVGGV